MNWGEWVVGYSGEHTLEILIQDLGHGLGISVVNSIVGNNIWTCLGFVSVLEEGPEAFWISSYAVGDSGYVFLVLSGDQILELVSE